MILGQRSYRRHMPHYQRDLRTYFVTFITKDRWVLPPAARDLVLRHILFEHRRRTHLHTAVVMPDHVHLLLTPECSPDGWTYDLATILKGIKGTSARSLNAVSGKTGAVWQHESFDHQLRHNENLRKIGEYIANNPVRKGLCATPDDYPWLWREWVNDVGQAL